MLYFFFLLFLLWELAEVSQDNQDINLIYIQDSTHTYTDNTYTHKLQQMDRRKGEPIEKWTECRKEVNKHFLMS